LLSRSDGVLTMGFPGVFAVLVVAARVSNS
jgi:hypothetical protein